jgi:hypothetical protein
MGSLRFRKQFKLAPGVKLNVNKQSLGITLGVRGAHLTYNTKGQRTASAGLPGTGLWYRDTRKVGPGRTRAAERARPASHKPVWSGDVNGTTLAIMANEALGHTSYELYVLADGVWMLAGRYRLYPEIMAAVQVWEAYLQGGGTVRAWLEHNKPMGELRKGA